MNIKKIIFIVFIYFLCIVNAKAETYQCEYKFERGGASTQSYTYIFEFDITNGTGKILNEEESTSGMYSSNYTYTYNFYENEIKTYTKNVCPILYMTLNYNNYNPQVNNYDYYIYSDSFLREEGGEACVTNRGELCLKNVFGGFTYYFTGTLTESDINKYNTEKSICPTYDLIKSELEKSYSDYNDCSNNCSSHITEANKNIDRLKKLCKNILQYSDVYIKNESDKYVKDECIFTCLSVSKNINEIKKKYGIEINSVNGQCGFSGKLITWIANIVKWGKYLVPVVVIVMGIIDFIQAIAADKDEGMKKAQGRFIKRLIAAALIFILPFIIEFVLNKMGFDANGCGIIDL